MNREIAAERAVDAITDKTLRVMANLAELGTRAMGQITEFQQAEITALLDLFERHSDKLLEYWKEAA